MGLQHEDPSVGYLFIGKSSYKMILVDLIIWTVWDKYQSHYDLMKDPDSKVYNGILSLLSVAHKGLTSMKHFDAEEEAALGALGSHLTSVSLSTFKSDGAKEAYKKGEVIDDVDLKKLFQDTKVVLGKGNVWAEGLCIDKDKDGKVVDDTLVVINGYESVEVREIFEYVAGSS